MFKLLAYTKCKLCTTEIKRKDAWKLAINTNDGPHNVKICNECRILLENGKENVSKWLMEE